MRKIRLYLAVIALTGLLANACESEGQNPWKLACEESPRITDKSMCNNMIDSFSLACAESGGRPNKNQCICNGQSCDAGMLCHEDTKECPINGCRTGEYRCFNDKDNQSHGIIQKCDEKAWINDVTCQSEVSCKDTSVQNTKENALANCGECLNNTQKCNENYKLSTCTDASWLATEEDCNLCENDQIECRDQDDIGQLWICKDYRYTLSSSCNEHSCNAEHSDCGECKNNSTICENNTSSGIGEIQTCTSGSWPEEATPCDHGVSCNELNACGECLNNLEQCKNDENGVGKKYICTDGQWADADTCQNQKSCKSDSDCGDCLNGNYKITGNGFPDPYEAQICSNGAWAAQLSDPVLKSNIFLSCEAKNLTFIADSFFTRMTFSDDSPFKCSDFKKVSEKHTLEVPLLDSYEGPCLFSVIRTGHCSYDRYDDEFGIGFVLFLSALYTDGSRNCEKHDWFCQTTANYQTNLNWFDCSTTECSRISLCIDSVSLGDEDGTRLPYLITFDSTEVTTTQKVTVTFEPAPEGCNSNHTAQASPYDKPEDCTPKTIDMTGKYQSSDMDTATFNICQYGHIRHIECDHLFEKDQFTCRFTTNHEDTSWWKQYRDKNNTMRTACIDFVNERFEQQSYVFYPKDVDHPNVVLGTASYKDDTPLEGSLDQSQEQGRIRQCAYGCNNDWTDCADKTDE